MTELLNLLLIINVGKSNCNKLYYQENLFCFQAKRNYTYHFLFFFFSIESYSKSYCFLKGFLTDQVTQIFKSSQTKYILTQVKLVTMEILKKKTTLPKYNCPFVAYVFKTRFYVNAVARWGTENFQPRTYQSCFFFYLRKFQFPYKMMKTGRGFKRFIIPKH